MNKIESSLISSIINVCNGLYGEIDSSIVMIEMPKEKKNGDYSTNIAMRLTKKLRKNPKIIAEEIVNGLNQSLESAEKIEIAGPGFINFYMKSEVLSSVIPNILKQDRDYGKSDFGQGIKYNIEYVSANPTGDLHPGHARGAALGDSIARLMSMAGYDVTREYYVNDAGNQINNLAKSMYARYHELFDVEMPMPENGYFGKDIIKIAEDLKAEFNDKYLNVPFEDCSEELQIIGIRVELEKLKKDLKAYNVEFDVWTSERSLYEQQMVEKALTRLKELDMTYELDGAVWLKTTNFNDDKDRVLVKSDGTYTYLTPDISYHLNKLDRGFDHLVDLFGADHHGYIARLKAAIQALGYQPDKLNVDIIQMVRMVKDGEEFKMSKRTGKAIALRDLIEEAGSDAVRYFFASRAADTQMDFDIDMAKRQTNENPVFYAQYAHARMCSILAAANCYKLADTYELINNEKEIQLLKHLNEFTNVVNDCAKNRVPNKMCNYIKELAGLFHSFYGECHVINKDDEALTSQRLALVKASQITLRNALNSIGVSAPEKM
jgi:arginyl-tRNA synthetase